MECGIFSRTFIHARFELVSALSIDSDNRGMSIACDDCGVPYVPASSLAGVLRHAMPQNEARQLFGYLSNKRGNAEESIQSKIIVSDGIFEDGWSFVIRDGVGLDEYHTAIDGAKYAVGAIDSGAKFNVEFEITFPSVKDDFLLNRFLEVLGQVNCGWIHLGGKANRGFGRLKVDRCTMKTYKKEDLLASLDHTQDLEYPVQLPSRQDNILCIKQKLRLDGTLCIRQYTPMRSIFEDQPADFMQLTSGGKPVIPGTSWAGVFRHGAERLLYRLGISRERSTELCAELFGFVDDNNSAASNVRFEDTFLEGGTMRCATRTAVDRVSGGAASQALYTEVFLSSDVEKCTGLLQIYLKQGKTCSKWGYDLIQMLIRELDAGRLHVGGGGAIGRGLFRIEEETYSDLADLIHREQTNGGAQNNDAI